jgi:hypothetical protein
MIVRTDLERCYLLVIGSLGGLSLAFADWFPLLALPGARIAIRWIFAALRENEDASISEEIEVDREQQGQQGTPQPAEQSREQQEPPEQQQSKGQDQEEGQK